MEEKKREEIMQNASTLLQEIKGKLDTKSQNIENISYFEDFEFAGSGLGINQIYIVKIQNKELTKKTDEIEQNKTKSLEEKDSELEYSTYEIYDKENHLIATVGKDGKVQFDLEYLQQLQEINPELYQTLRLEGLDFKLPEELKENDMLLTEDDLAENAQRSPADKKSQKNQEEKNSEAETIDDRKIAAAKVLGVKKEDIKGLSQINPNEKVTDEHNMRDLIPEAQNYDKIEIVCSNSGDSKQGDARFTMLGVKKDGTREVLNSINSVEGVSTNKNVISINEDGSEVTEKSVQGLMRINSGNREDGIAIGLGDYGMLNISYVRDIMDKEHRRTTPIKTLDSENRQNPTHKVRENAGDSIQEVEQESQTYRENEEEGINPQSLDGIEKDNNLEFIKQRIISNALEREEMSGEQLRDFIREELEKENISLNEQERENIVDEIEERVVDESRFPVRGEKK